MTLVGTTLGRIRIVEPLGKGGMGDVYVGYDETLKRKVALKAIRDERRLDAETKARFLREARVLSQLDHPNICQIHEFIEGDDSDFLVLELIDGETLKKALEDSELSQSFKLHVAERVTDALVAAHAKGIAHRDLKPENVMLTTDGGVKVLDFGLAYTVDENVAAALEGDGSSSFAAATPATSATSAASATSATAATGSLPPLDPTVVWDRGADTGIPADLSPTRPGTRQALATGSVPSGDTTPTDFIETQHGIVMGTVAYMSPEQARGERATVAGDMYSLGLILQELFTGQSAYETGLELLQMLLKVGSGETLTVTGVDPDLANLITELKSLDPQQRPSATETANRLRWIRGKPARRMLRRIAVAVVVVLVLGLLKYTFEIQRERNKAIAASREAEEVSEFLVSLFAVSDPSSARGNSITARELLDYGATKITTQLDSQPSSRARLMLTMGRVYRQLGLYDQALPLLEEGLEIQQSLLGDEHLDTGFALDLLANLYHDQGDYERAEPLFRRALEIRQQALGDEHPSVAAGLNNLAFLHRTRGDNDSAEPLFLRALSIQEKAYGQRHVDVASTHANLGDLYRSRGAYDQAEANLRRAIDLQEQLLAPDHPSLASSLNNLAVIYHEQGRTSLAEPLFERTLEIYEKVLGSEHPDVATCLNNLAELYRGVGDYSRAAPLYQRALAIQQQALGASDHRVAITLSNLADLHSARGEAPQAEAFYERVLAIQETAFGSDHPSVAVTLNHQADLYQGSDNAASAEALYRRALTIQENAFGRDHPSVAITVADLADLFGRQGRHEDAQRLYLRAQASAKQTQAEQPNSALARHRLAAIKVGLGRVYQAAGATRRATESWTRAEEMMAALTPNSELVAFLHTHTLALLYLGRIDDARPMVTKLQERGWRHPDFLELCQEHGLAL